MILVLCILHNIVVSAYLLCDTRAKTKAILVGHY